MTDELEDIITAWAERHHFPVTIEWPGFAADLAAAIRERFCIGPDHRYYWFDNLTGTMVGHSQCYNCGQPKPSPTPANGFTAVVKGKKVEVGDVVKLNDDGTVSKATPEDERGEDAEAIKMWRDK